MSKSRAIFPLMLLIATFVVFNSCTSQNEGTRTGQGTSTGNGTSSEEPEQNPYQAAELLAKRLILYKLAFQEGDLAPSTALPETLEDRGFPEIPLQLNQLWWEIDWDGAHIAPLPALEITSLESEIFPYIAVRVDESDDEAGWVGLTLGYDASMIRFLIADAHSEWSIEMRESYMMTRERGCLHVWCGLVNGEWKLISHLPCFEDETSPSPPAIPVSVSPTGSADEVESAEESDENPILEEEANDDTSGEAESGE